jgi:hypothetical protein
MQKEFLVIRDYPGDDLLRAWRDFLARADYPAHFASPEYFLEPFIQHKRPFAVLAMQAGSIAGVLTGLESEGRISCGLPGAPQVALLPKADREVERRLSEGLLEAAGNAKLIMAFGWTPLEAFAERGFRSRQLPGVAMLDLRLGSEALLRAFPQRRQTYVRKAIRAGVDVHELTGPQELIEYYDVYVTWSKSKGLPFHSFDLLERAFQLRNNRRLFVARHGEKVIGGLVVRMCPGGIVEFTANSSLADSLRLRPNDLLHWRAIEWACSEGYSWYKLGSAPYVRQGFGAKMVPTYRVRLDRSFLRRYDCREFLENEARRFIGVSRRALSRTLRQRQSTDSSNDGATSQSNDG